MTRTVDPQEFDTTLAGLHHQLAKTAARRTSLTEKAHRMAGDKKRSTGYGHRQVWNLSNSEAIGELARRANVIGIAAGDVLAGITAADGEIAILRNQIAAMDATYAQDPWNRYILCLAHDGHIHRFTGCHTLSFGTQVEWRTDLSGHEVDEAVALLGPALCTHCYKDAPVEYKAKTLTQVERERTQGARDAEKAARNAAKAAKQLAEDEQFRTTGRFPERVTTVARCKELIRKAIEQAVEVEFYARPEAAAKWQGDTARLAQFRSNIADTLAGMEADAQRAADILIAREGAHEGWGATAAEIAKIRASKDKAARKEWGV